MKYMAAEITLSKQGCLLLYLLLLLTKFLLNTKPGIPASTSVLPHAAHISTYAVKQSPNTLSSNLQYIEISEKKPQVRARKQSSLQTDFRKFVKTRCQLQAFSLLYFLHISCYFSLVSSYSKNILLLGAPILVILQSKPMC